MTNGEENMAAVKYREVTSVEIREAFRQQLSITEIQAANIRQKEISNEQSNFDTQRSDR